jgi:RNA polymerase sigma-70 factor, ECF subfamily
MSVRWIGAVLEEGAASMPDLGNDSGASLQASVVKLAQAGDSDAFARIYGWYHTDIHRYLLGLVSSEEDASDLTQETFLHAWRAISGLRDVALFKSWLYKIARNCAYDFMRKKKGILISLESISEDQSIEMGTSFEDGIAQGDLVRQVLASIPLNQRDCLLLQDMGGFSQYEIAKLVGIGVQSVSTYISMARNQFRQTYNALLHQRGAQ